MSPPGLILLHDYGGDWPTYETALYDVFLGEIVNGECSFQNHEVRFAFHPNTDGKYFSFWHAISEGSSEDERTPDLRRCERLRWIPWVLQRVQESEFRVWENRRHGNTHTIIWCVPHDYVVILAKRSGYYLFKTAYCLKPHRKKALEKEWREWLALKR